MFLTIIGGGERREASVLSTCGTTVALSVNNIVTTNDVKFVVTAAARA